MAKAPVVQAEEQSTAPAMRIEWWPIDKPKPYPTNARKWGPNAIAKVGSSIKHYGWRQPIVVDKDGIIVIGHLRREAGKSVGETQCPVTPV
jgi:ParB-like chromosome segregation protein Spo0J